MYTFSESRAIARHVLRKHKPELLGTGSLEQAVITAAMPVINYPNVATLWFSRINQRPRVNEQGQLEAGPMLSGALSFDHRFLHGADALRFINTLDAIIRDGPE